MDAYYGQTLAYSEGLSENDAMLASALFRNMYSSTNDTVSVQDLYKCVKYVRGQLNYMEALSSSDILDGKIDFLTIDEEGNLQKAESGRKEDEDLKI